MPYDYSLELVELLVHLGTIQTKESARNATYPVRPVRVQDEINVRNARLVGDWQLENADLSVLKTFFRGKRAVADATITARIATVQDHSAVRHALHIFH